MKWETKKDLRRKIATLQESCSQWAHDYDVIDRACDRIAEQAEISHAQAKQVPRLEAEKARLQRLVEEYADEIQTMRDTWDPPTIDTMFRYAQEKLNDDYWELPREPKWRRAKDPIDSPNPILGEQPPLTECCGSLGMNETPPLRIPRPNERAGL